MQKSIILIGAIILLLAQTQNTLAQNMVTKKPSGPKVNAASLSKDSSKTHTNKDTMTAIELSPVSVPVALDENNSKFHYTTLSPLPFAGNLVSGNLNDEVTKFIKTYFARNERHFESLQSRSAPYFPLIEKIFSQYGIPNDLKYLAVIESGLNTHARSSAGAVGAWQFMASTARLLGLRVNGQHDDRKNIYKSTVAAAKYLSKLHGMLDNWLLVVAAYNCGPGGVLNAIQTSGSSDFWKLKKYLPAESQKHVMKFLATTYIMDRFASFFGVDKDQLAVLNFNTGNKDNTQVVNQGPLSSLQISGKYSLSVIAKYISMDLTELNKLNPEFDKMLSNTTQAYTLRLPAAKMILFKDNKNKILNASINLLMENNREVTRADFPIAPKPQKQVQPQ